MEWFSYVIAIGVGLSAVISPIATSLINNHHQLKLKKLDMYEEAKRKALNDFIEYAEDYLLNLHDVSQNVKYYSALTKLFLYFPNISLTMFSPFEKAVKDNDYSAGAIYLANIVQVLSKQLKKE